MIYLANIARAWQERPEIYGYITTYVSRGDDYRAIPGGALWMMDNGVFSGRFDPLKWERRIARWVEYADTCIGVIIPDAVDWIDGSVVGNWRGTREMFYQYSPIARGMGLPCAYALQDDHPLAAVPFDDFDTLFVAGSTEYKLSAAAEKIALEARRRGKWIHVGRVNSNKRMKIVGYADSVDGTAFRWKQNYQMDLFARGIEAVRASGHQLRIL